MVVLTVLMLSIGVSNTVNANVASTIDDHTQCDIQTLAQCSRHTQTRVYKPK